jgi:hypothetical protein
MEVAEGNGVDYMSSVFDDAMDVANVLASPEAKGDERPGTPNSQPSIDFSCATPESKLGLPFDEPEAIAAHDSFEFLGGLDIFSTEGDVDDDKSISDISDDETRKKRKQKKSKPVKERKPPKAKAEEPEIRKVSVVESEIEVGQPQRTITTGRQHLPPAVRPYFMQAVKKLETGPSVAELRRRNLIEM